MYCALRRKNLNLKNILCKNYYGPIKIGSTTTTAFSSRVTPLQHVITFRAPTLVDNRGSTLAPQDLISLRVIKKQRIPQARECTEPTLITAPDWFLQLYP